MGYTLGGWWAAMPKRTKRIYLLAAISLMVLLYLMAECVPGDPRNPGTWR